MNFKQHYVVRFIIYLLISVGLGFALMFPLGWLFGTMNWPVFHSWGLFHGAFIIAWPLLTLISWGLVRGVRAQSTKKGQTGD